MRRRMEKLFRALRMPTVYRDWPTAYRHRLARRATGGEVTYRLRGGVQLAVNDGPSDVRVINEIWLDHIYAPSRELRVRDGWRVVDLGAHKGTFTVFAAAAGAAEVHSVEPSPANLPLLRRNIELNALDTVTVHEFAVADVRGRATLYSDPDLRHLGSTTINRGGDDHYDVATVTFDDVVAAAGGVIDLMKVDVEGAELASMTSASAGALQTVRRFVIECHEVGGLKAAEVASTLDDLLTPLGFRCVWDPERKLLSAVKREAA